MDKLERIIIAFGDYSWGPWLLVLLLGGGCFFLAHSRLITFRYFKHGIDIIRGKYDIPDDMGNISHFQVLSSTLTEETIGMGNIAVSHR